MGFHVERSIIEPKPYGQTFKFGLIDGEAVVRMGLADSNLKLANNWVEGMNKHDEKFLGTLLTDDAVAVETAFPDEAFRGKAAVVEAYRELFESFPDSKTEITSSISADNGVLLEVAWSGTNEKPFRGTPATGKHVKLPIGYVFYTRGGKINKIHEYYDELTVELQMGLRT